MRGKGKKMCAFLSTLHVYNGTGIIYIYSIYILANAQIMVFRQMSHIVIRYLR